MTVRELIYQLEKCHPDDKVRVSDGYEEFYDITEIVEINCRRIGYVTLLID